MAATQAIKRLDPQTKNLIKEVAHRLHSHEEELVNKWTEAYKASLPQQAKITEKEAFAKAQELVRSFFDLVEHGRFDEYFDCASGVGEAYAEQGLPYAELALIPYLLGNTSLSFIKSKGVYPQAAEAEKALAALNRFDLNLLAVLSDSYCKAQQEGLQRRYEEEIAEIGRRRESFIGMVVHDIRGPLTSILGFSQIIERALDRGKPCEPRQVEIISREAKRINRMVEEFSELSIVEAKRLEVERKPTDIVAVARDVISQMQEAATSHQLTLSAPGKPVIGNWDPNRLPRVFSYLIDNAIKLSPEAGEVAVEIKLADDKVEVTVANRSASIPEQFLPRVFEPFSTFYRENRIKGMGMGLFIAKGIVEALGGRMWVESKPDQGTFFKFVIPRQ